MISISHAQAAAYLVGPATQHTVRVTDALWDAVHKKAKEDGLTPQKAIRLLLVAYLTDGVQLKA